MATTKKSTKAAPKKATPKGKPATTKAARVREPIGKPEKATFTTDNKMAQYARLVVFNYAKKNAKALKITVPKDADVNSVSASVLNTAALALANGNELAGNDGLELITDLSKAGATDSKVAERGLTKAYAAEVRPYLRRARLADQFARRTKVAPKKEEKPSEEPKEEPEEEPAGTEE